MREKENAPLGGMLKARHFKLTKRNAKPALTGRHYPSIKVLPSEEEIYDPETNKTRTIRYAVGESSIYKDEQPQVVVKSDIIFQNGSIIVAHTNPSLIEFLTLSNHNAENPHRKTEKRIMFKELNPAKDAEQALEIEEAQARAKALVFTLPFDEIKGYARVCGVNTKRSASEIKHDMVTLAGKDPKGFMAGLDDPLTKRQQVIMDACTVSVLEISGKGAFWKHGDTKNLIIPIPAGQDGIVWFAEWTMTDEDGKDVFKEIAKKTETLMA
jgi:hypothetical protein